MRSLCLVCALVFSIQLQAGELSHFGGRIYTPKHVVDHQSLGPKGAVQLLWEKNPVADRYEIQVSNGVNLYTVQPTRNFHHVMLYYGKDYQWRVREIHGSYPGEFSHWRPLKVTRDPSRQWAHVSSGEVESFVLDFGDE
jgi:hypothetical protein